MDLEDETGFKDIDVSEPSSPESIDDDEDHFSDGPDVSKTRKRGKGVSWSVSLHSEESFETVDAVKQDARNSNLSKLGASTHNSHIFACKIEGCSYKRKYKQHAFGLPFKIYYSGIHAHLPDEIGIYRTQLQGDENLKTRLPSENSYRCDREVCYNVLQLPDVLHELPIRCNIRISGIFVLSERRRRKFYGTQRPQSAPSSFISPWSNHQTEYILGMTNLTDFLIK